MLDKKCEGAPWPQSVLSQSVTNASLDAWRGPFIAVIAWPQFAPQLPTLHKQTHTSTCTLACIFLHSHSWHSHVLYTTQTPTSFPLHYLPFSSVNSSAFTVRYYILQFRFLKFNVLCNFSQINSTGKHVGILAVNHIYIYTVYIHARPLSGVSSARAHKPALVWTLTLWTWLLIIPCAGWTGEDCFIIWFQWFHTSI